MRIMVAIGSLRFSGAERVLVSLTNALMKQGHEIIFLAMKDDNSSPYKDPINNGVDIHIIDYSGGIITKNIKRIVEINKIIRKKKPDVIIAFGYILSPIVNLASLFTNVPTIISERNDPILEPEMKFYRFLRRITYPLATKLVVQTEEIANFFKPFMKDKIEIIPNPITNTNIPDVHKGVRKLNIVSVGRLDQKQKNQLLLINAFSLISNDYPNFELVIYGEGQDRGVLEDEINKLSMQEQVQLPGQKDNIMSVIKDAKMFVLTSEFEGMPNALIEAMAMGMPCISTDCGGGGARALIKSYSNGIIVPRNNALELSNAMKFIIDNPEKADDMGNEAVNIREILSIDNIVMKWNKVIYDCLSKEGKV